jgi:hypothetical protein
MGARRGLNRIQNPHSLRTIENSFFSKHSSSVIAIAFALRLRFQELQYSRATQTLLGTCIQASNVTFQETNHLLILTQRVVCGTNLVAEQRFSVRKDSRSHSL